MTLPRPLIHSHRSPALEAQCKRRSLGNDTVSERNVQSCNAKTYQSLSSHQTRVSGGFVGGYLPKSRPNDFVNASRCAAMQGTHGSAPTTSSRVVVSVVKSMTSETRDGTRPSPDRKTRMNNERRPGLTVRVITLSKNGRRYVWTRSCAGPRLIDSQEFHSFIHPCHV